MSERDIVILFGAGASYGAGHVEPGRPPLGADLYDALAVRYPDIWGSTSHIGAMWAAQFRQDFERAMSEEVLPNVPSLSLLEWHRPVAEFFARYRLDGSGRDMYSVLVRDLSEKERLGRVVFGTLNYDCLLEQALLDLDFTVDYMLDNANEASSVPVAKIHGSCNFVSDDLYSWRHHLVNANASSLECSFTPLQARDLVKALRRQFSTYRPAIYPVLGLYSPHKPSMLAPAKLQTVRNFLAQSIERATTVVLIGIKPNAGDPHLWGPVAKSRARKINYIGGTSDYGALKLIQDRAFHVAETFDAGLAPILRTLSDE